MKNIVQIQSVLLLAFFLSLPVSIFSQDEGEKKVTVKTVKEVGGEKVVMDTTFVVNSEDDVQDIVNKFTLKSEGDSTATIMVDVSVETDEEIEWETNEGEKVVIIRKGNSESDPDVRVEKKIVVIDENGNEERVMVYPHGSQHRTMRFKGDDGEEEIVMVSPHGKHKVIRWTSEDGEDYDFDFDMDVDMEKFNEEMAKLDEEMKAMQFEFLDEEGNLTKEIIELKTLEELEGLEDLERLKNMEVIVVPPRPPHPHAPRFEKEFYWHQENDMEVSDIELRDAGIKNQPDRLEMNEIDIENEDGVVELSFSLAQEGNPKVAVYNVHGDKVFSGKPELMNDNYEIKMDLSKKQFGTYYLQIVDGKSSKTVRLNL